MYEAGTLPTILCCMCGIEIKQNSANMCVTCLRNEVDITDGIKTELTIHSCRSCQRFLGRVHFVDHNIEHIFCKATGPPLCDLFFLLLYISETSPIICCDAYI